MNAVSPSKGRPISAMRPSNQWDAMFEQLVRFKAVHGHSMIPQNDKDNRQLELWVETQRKNRKYLSSEQLHRLEDIAFNWVSITDSSETWDVMFDRLAKYKLEHGNCIVSQSHTSKYPQLVQWIQSQRSNENMLTSNQKEKLDGIGFVWSAQKKRSRAQLWSQANAWLASTWFDDFMGKIPAAHKKMKLQDGVDGPSEEEELTEAVKQSGGQDQSLPSTEPKRVYGWTPKNQKRWMEMYSRLKDYKEKHGDCMVPGRYKTDPSLGTWVSQQRQIKGEIAEDRKELLDEIGFVWTVRKIQTWDTMYDRLVQYKAKYGDCLVPETYLEDPKLSSWVILQRKDKTKMSVEHRERLNFINFCWNPEDGHHTAESNAALFSCPPRRVLAEQGQKGDGFMPLAPRPSSCPQPPTVPQQVTTNTGSENDIQPFRPWHSKSYQQSVNAHKALHANIIFGAFQALEASQKVQGKPSAALQSPTLRHAYSKAGAAISPNPMTVVAPILPKPPTEQTLLPRVQSIAPRPVQIQPPSDIRMAMPLQSDALQSIIPRGDINHTIIAPRPTENPSPIYGRAAIGTTQKQSDALQCLLPRVDANRSVAPLPAQIPPPTDERVAICTETKNVGGQPRTTINPQEQSRILPCVDIQPLNTDVQATKQANNAKSIEQHSKFAHGKPHETRHERSIIPDKIDSFSKSENGSVQQTKKPERCDEIPVKDLSMLLVWGECETTKNNEESGEAKLVGVIANAQPEGAKYGEVDVALFFVSNAGLLAEPLIQRIRSRYLFRVEKDSEEAGIAKEWNKQRDQMLQNKNDDALENDTRSDGCSSPSSKIATSDDEFQSVGTITNLAEGTSNTAQEGKDPQDTELQKKHRSRKGKKSLDTGKLSNVKKHKNGSQRNRRRTLRFSPRRGQKQG